MRSKLTVLTTALLIVAFGVPMRAQKMLRARKAILRPRAISPPTTRPLRTLAQVMKVQRLPMTRAAGRIRVATTANAPRWLSWPRGTAPRADLRSVRTVKPTREREEQRALADADA